MSLAVRVIATILCRGPIALKGRGFRAYDRPVGSVLDAARVYSLRETDEIIILDVLAGAHGDEPDYALVEHVSAGISVPLTVGGGIRKLEHVEKLLRSGADRVVVSTGGLPLITEIATRFGSQAVVAALDVKDWRVYLDSGRAVLPYDPASCPPACAAQRLQGAGCGEILLQSIERDGTMDGYDLALIKRVTEGARVPVVASGGCSGAADMIAAVRAGADAVAAGALWRFTEATPDECKAEMRAAGLVVR